MSTSAWPCPDLSGIYRFEGFGPKCRLFDTNVVAASPIPVAAPGNAGHIQPGATFEVVQSGCEKIEIRYSDPTYVPGQRNRAVEIALKPRDRHETFRVDSTAIGYRRIEWDHACWFGACLSGRHKARWTLSVDSTGDLQASARDSMFGVYDFIVPIIDLQRFDCAFPRVNTAGAAEFSPSS